MSKAKRLVLTNEWVEIKEIFEANTNGKEEYNENFEIGGELDIAKQEEIDRKVAEEEAKWESEFDVIDDYEPTDKELRETEKPEFNNIDLELEIE